MPHNPTAVAQGPLYLPPPREEPDIAGALPSALALIAFGVLLIIFGPAVFS